MCIYSKSYLVAEIIPDLVIWKPINLAPILPPPP